MNLFDPITRMFHKEGAPLTELKGDEKQPLSIVVASHQWGNPDVMQPGVRNPFLLQLNISLEATKPMNIEQLVIGLDKDTVSPLDGFKPFALQAVAGISARFEIPYERAVKALGPLVLITVNGATIRTKRFRIPAVPT